MYILILIILLILLLSFLFIYPLTITVYNDDKYLYIKVSYFITLKLNIYKLFEESNREELQKQSKSIRIIKKLKFKEINIYLRGINYNYSLSGAYYGLLCAIFPIIDSILESNDITFNYLVDYNGDLYIKFKGIVKSRAFNVFKAFYGI